jgi:signal transduction histidine kinase
MIKKLRRQLILVIMAVVTVLIAAAFIAVYSTTSASLARVADYALRDALKKVDAPQGGLGFGLEMRRLATITVVIDESGNMLSVRDRFFNLENADIIKITSRALSSRAAEGVLRDYNLQYVVTKTSEGLTVVAFVDVSVEKEVIDDLLLDFALIGGATLLLFFAFSILLSHWIVRPVELAWNSQRQFIADASHELKTPLTVILSNVEMLSDAHIRDETAADGKTRIRLENILEEARRMRGLVNDLLVLARSDMPGGKKTYENVDLSGLISNTVLNFEPVAFDAGLRLDDIIESGLFVRGDRTRLCQLAEILLDNAMKYSLAGGLITVRLTPSAKSELLLEISNESETIPKSELPNLFKRFYRLDKARSGSGHGLGLAIADSIVREHGGKIWAKSENNLTAFCVSLPAVKIKGEGADSDKRTV